MLTKAKRKLTPDDKNLTVRYAKLPRDCPRHHNISEREVL